MNPCVGDLAANRTAIVQWAQRAAEQGADLVVFPEMALVGYPPEDLVLRGGFQAACEAALQQVMADTANLPCTLLVGGLKVEDGAIYNAAFLIEGGQLLHWQAKTALPTYGVFDEKRTFAAGEQAQPVSWRGTKLGLLICEEAWDVRLPMKRKADGAELLVVQNASPFEMHKNERRLLVMRAAAKAASLPLIYLNMVGGQDELVFDGSSFVLDAQGNEVARLNHCEEQLAMLRFERTEKGWGCVDAQHEEAPDLPARTYGAMVLALRDYVHKNGFKGVVLGLSGGIDSALSATVAVDALGADAVLGVLMPSPFTSDDSVKDALELAANLGIETRTIPIEMGMVVAEQMLDAGGLLIEGVTEENIQSRLRGLTLMAISNATAKMVLTTGNKSELAVGYATLYGDMCGGYNVLGDVYKTQVWELAKWRNELRVASCELPVIPHRSITKAPSAELRPNQTDQDSLPPYERLDAILQGLIEERKSVPELVAGGMDGATVERVFGLLKRAEYKRRQAAPCAKLTSLAFGRDWRMPMTGEWL